MIKGGVILLACTAAVMFAEFFRRRTRPFPVYGWVGLVSLLISEWLMFRGVEPIATFFTPIAWTAYAFIADAAVFRDPRAFSSPRCAREVRRIGSALHSAVA